MKRNGIILPSSVTQALGAMEVPKAQQVMGILRQHPQDCWVMEIKPGSKNWPPIQPEGRKARREMVVEKVFE